MPQSNYSYESCTETIGQNNTDQNKKQDKTKKHRKQFGFVADRGTMNAIFTMTMVIEKSTEIQKDMISLLH